jgi:uncharacterized membrane protein
MGALRLLQMNTTLDELRARGAKVLGDLYTQPAAPAARPQPSLPPVTQTVVWEKPGTLLQRIDLAALREVAITFDVVVEVHAALGGELRRGDVVFSLRGGERSVPEADLVRHLQTGADRTFAQDPLFGFRLLNDIAIRSLSAAVNDPASAVSAIAGVDDLLRLIATRELDAGWVSDADGRVLVVLHMPTWEDFVHAGVDDVLPYAATAPMAAERLARLLDSLEPIVPSWRRPAVAARRRLLSETMPG